MVMPPRSRCSGSWRAWPEPPARRPPQPAGRRRPAARDRPARRRPRRLRGRAGRDARPVGLGGGGRARTQRLGRPAAAARPRAVRVRALLGDGRGDRGPPRGHAALDDRPVQRHPRGRRRRSGPPRPGIGPSPGTSAAGSSTRRTSGTRASSSCTRASASDAIASCSRTRSSRTRSSLRSWRWWATLGLDGVNVDIEAIDPLFTASYNGFVNRLRAALVAADPDDQVSVATQANTPRRGDGRGREPGGRGPDLPDGVRLPDGGLGPRRDLTDRPARRRRQGPAVVARPVPGRRGAAREAAPRPAAVRRDLAGRRPGDRRAVDGAGRVVDPA